MVVQDDLGGHKLVSQRSYLRGNEDNRNTSMSISWVIYKYVKTHSNPRCSSKILGFLRCSVIYTCSTWGL